MKECEHGYGDKQGPCQLCDAPTDLLGKRALLFSFAQFICKEVEIDYEAYMRKYDLIYVNDDEFPTWLLEAFERDIAKDVK
jgi:hypothetical protein